MKTQAVVLIGAGPHAAVVAEAVQALGRYELVGLTDPDATLGPVLGLPLLGGDDVLVALRERDVNAAVISVGDNALRQQLAAKARALGFALPPIIHPQAFIAPSARIEDGAIIMARAVVGTKTVVRELAIVNTGAIVDHDGIVGTAAHIAPGCAIAGSVTIGERALVGVGSAVRPGVTIGRDAVVAAGSAVVDPVPDGARVGGVPARALDGRSARAE